MRELVIEGQEVLVIPSNYKNSVIGKVTEVRAGDFTLELETEPQNILINTYCEFYTQTKHGKLYFDSFAKEINGKTMIIASPAKHKFLQRRQYTRVKYVNDFEMFYNNNGYKITTLDISAGGMKIKTNEKIDIEGNYAITIPVSETKSLSCNFQPIRIEKANEGGYTISGQFTYNSTHDKMVLTQFCAKRSFEIKNK
jgi:hypothetical protein